MLDRINEPDWKIFRRLHATWVERFCDRVLAEVMVKAHADGQNSHERYLAVWDLLQKRNDEMAVYDHPKEGHSDLIAISENRAT